CYPRKDGFRIMTATSSPSTTTSTQSGTRHRRRVGRNRVTWSGTIILVVCSLTVLIPLYVTVNMSLKTTSQAVDGNAFGLPSPVSLSGFVEAWNLTNFPRGFTISVFVTVLAVAGEILVSSMAAYAIVRNWKRRLFRWSFYYLL